MTVQVIRMSKAKTKTGSIFIPSGMVNSKITEGPYHQEGVAHGYELKYNRYVKSDYGENATFPAAGNGGLCFESKVAHPYWLKTLNSK